ncbi:hypothetical protein [Streptomyces achromogenes]|uniref:hypothetical protein n=1 Tax=Streptomyces achromogenes TaxID=67255 RepID=UPI0033F7F964
MPKQDTQQLSSHLAKKITCILPHVSHSTPPSDQRVEGIQLCKEEMNDVNHWQPLMA